MPNEDGVTRRIFLERLAAGALLGASGSMSNPARAANQGGWTPPPVLKNPNILIIMVDQLRPPMWLNDAQLASLSQSLPNIVGLQNTAYNFEQFFVSATACTASRAGLLTGLYAPQTAMYVNADLGSSAPALNPAFPTWGQALPNLNSAYQGNMWWFGKWHLTSQISASPPAPYGFKTRTYPGGTNVDPSGVPNEGVNGGPFGRNVWASDAMITSDFLSWLGGQAPATAPWCATVSLVNPHDICGAPAWIVNPIPSGGPPGVTAEPVYFNGPTGTPPPLYNSEPNPWNFENLQQVSNKPTLQYNDITYSNNTSGAVTTAAGWVSYLNIYFWMQSFVDAQIGNILTALGNSAFASNTVIIFLSDHGELGGSHGLRYKGFAAYDESIRAPFYVKFPGQAQTVAMNQMFSGVDFFGLMCDLATGGSGQWRLAYPDLANRQSLWSFLYNNSPETRIAPAPIGLPYIFHTFDSVPVVSGKNHIICMRTKQDPSWGAPGAKIAFYSEWGACTAYPDATPPDPEFYDYSNNTMEMGNDYYSTNPSTVTRCAQYVQAMGSLIPPATGLTGSELNAPLVGVGTDRNPLTQAQAAAQQAYFASLGSAGCGGA